MRWRPAGESRFGHQRRRVEPVFSRGRSAGSLLRGFFGDRGSGKSQTAPLIGPGEGDPAGFGQAIGGKLDGLAAVEDGGGNVRGQEGKLQDTAHIGAGDPFVRGDSGDACPAGQQPVPPVVGSNDGLDQAWVGIGRAVARGAVDDELQLDSAGTKRRRDRDRVVSGGLRIADRPDLKGLAQGRPVGFPVMALR